MSVGTWLIVAGAMLYSILTVTPLMAAHTPAAWRWTAPILPLVVDAAVVIVVRLDSVLARLGGDGGRWPVVLRWMTGCMTLALNVGDSALKEDLVGVAVHAVAPLLLIITAETGLAYRRGITNALTALQEREQADREARERAAAEQAEAADKRERDKREFEARMAREQHEHEAALLRGQADREAQARREEAERAEAAAAAERAERERREQALEQQRAECERLEHEAAARAEQDRVEHEASVLREQREQAARAERERAELLAAGPAQEQQSKDQALRTVAAAFAAGLSVRAAAELCGWSTGWVTGRYQELRDHTPALEGASR